MVKVIPEELPINMQGRQRAESLDGFYNVKPGSELMILMQLSSCVICKKARDRVSGKKIKLFDFDNTKNLP